MDFKWELTANSHSAIVVRESKKQGKTKPWTLNLEKSRPERRQEERFHETKKQENATQEWNNGKTKNTNTTTTHEHEYTKTKQKKYIRHIWKAYCTHPDPTGPPMPTVNARSWKSRIDKGGARRLKKPGDSRGSCVWGANPSCVCGANPLLMCVWAGNPSWVCGANPLLVCVWGGNPSWVCGANPLLVCVWDAPSSWCAMVLGIIAQKSKTEENWRTVPAVGKEVLKCLLLLWWLWSCGCCCCCCCVRS